MASMARREDVLERARKILARFAQLATELDLPLILHCPHQTAGEALKIIETREGAPRGLPLAQVG